MSYQRLVINYGGTAVDFKSVSDLAPGGFPALNNFIDFLGGLSGGAYQGALLAFKVGAVHASGTVTIASMVANDTVTVAGIVLTAVASGATGAQFNIGASPTNNATATALAAKINTYAPLSGIATATALAAVATVTAGVPGLIGNGLGLAVSAHATVSAALLAGGSDGTAYNVDLR